MQVYSDTVPPWADGNMCCLAFWCMDEPLVAIAWNEGA